MPKAPFITRCLREMVVHLDRAESQLAEVKVRGPVLRPLGAVLADLEACQRLLAEMEIHASG